MAECGGMCDLMSARYCLVLDEIVFVNFLRLKSHIPALPLTQSLVVWTEIYSRKLLPLFMKWSNLKVLKVLPLEAIFFTWTLFI